MERMVSTVFLFRISPNSAILLTMCHVEYSIHRQAFGVFDHDGNMVNFVGMLLEAISIAWAYFEIQIEGPFMGKRIAYSGKKT